MMMVFKKFFFIVVVLLLFMGVQQNAHGDWAYYVGSEYSVETGYPDVYRTCCPGSDCLDPPDCSQRYAYGIYGIDYNYSGGSGTLTAPCAGVIVANNFLGHVAKFAYRLHEQAPIKCGAPSYRWENLPDNGGLIHASVDIDHFDGAGS